MADYRICKRDGRWLLFERGVLFDSFDSLWEAHSYALASTLSNELFKPGGLVRFAALVDAANWWQAYESACEECA